MNQKNLRALPWDHIWVNLNVRHREHIHTCAAYVLIHESTGHYYFGATNSLYNHFQTVTSLLKYGKHGSRRLQALFKRDPRFRVVGVVTNGRGRNMGDARLVAEEIKQLWIAAHMGDSLMLNEVQAKGARLKPVSWRQRQVCVKGHVFTNPREAAKMLGLTEGWVRLHCDDTKLRDWQWV